MAEHNVGEEVTVTDRQEGHQFFLGQKIWIKKVNRKTGGYLCTDGDEEWWLTEEEFEGE